MKPRTTPRTKTFLAAATLSSASFGLPGCIDFVSGFDGQPLDKLDTSGEAPTEIALAGPDDIVLKVGEALDIRVEGNPDVLETLRFKRSGNMLGIGRASAGRNLDGKAIIHVIMPAPSEVSIAGSGDISAQTLARAAEISIAGSGEVDVAQIASDNLEITVAGSGSISGFGTVSSLQVTIAGSGDVDFQKVAADTVDISIAGSGDVNLASDGRVESAIMGSGDVFVTGSATCKTSALGSGKATCAPAQKAITSDDTQGEASARR